MMCKYFKLFNRRKSLMSISIFNIMDGSFGETLMIDWRCYFLVILSKREKKELLKLNISFFTFFILCWNLTDVLYIIISTEYFFTRLFFPYSHCKTKIMQMISILKCTLISIGCCNCWSIYKTNFYSSKLY